MQATELHLIKVITQTINKLPVDVSYVMCYVLNTIGTFIHIARCAEAYFKSPSPRRYVCYDTTGCPFGIILTVIIR